ncbi:fumarylacetoacetate hydrolase family protein [Leucobacter sp. wl10]|uniref:fumarylacetoacetate hydrolase family protein n=1 Tax=Leucobacter sp. wl10 TaxID=2304677 RepID=UPI000E5A46AE|nr:fumarylacetoacetate hydrolase family protein [Leucobacter sp. wl10]RGE20043.1 fumarylacetoacetate hydrolase family protein [Leucobacter sp. wl10]
MKLGRLAGSAVLITNGGAIDVARASGGRFGPDLDGIYERWSEFAAWADGPEATGAAAEDFDEAALEAPVGRPRQIFAIGLNYAAHAAEAGLQPARDLVVFTKFASSIAGPVSRVPLPTGTVDWEVEIVAIIGEEARRVTIDEAWDRVAGLAIGQDLSERTMQLHGQTPQFSLAKSHPGFSPVGPALVTLDELPDRDAIEFGCAVDGQTMQSGNTRNLLFSIPEIISELSRVVTLYPGDVIFTGTPDGVGLGRDPKVYLQPGQTLVSSAAGLGEIRSELTEAE